MNKWWRVSWKRVAIALLLVFGSLWLIRLAQYQLQPWFIARVFAHTYPWLNEVPSVPQDNALAPLSGVRIEFYGLSIQTPWKEIARTRSYSASSVVDFKGGANMLIFDPAKDRESAFLNQLRTKHLLDDQVLRSSYTLKMAEMAATSKQVKWWQSPRKNVEHLLPFTLKLAELTDARVIYSVGSGEFRGFQKGNPSITPYWVVLDLYDSMDHHYKIWISGDHPVLSQSEINAMVGSLQRTVGK